MPVRIHTARWKPADGADIPVGNQNSLMEKIDQGGEPQSNFLHPANDGRVGTGNFHQVAHIHGVTKNQCQSADDVLNQSLRTKADGQADDRGAGQVCRQVHADFLQD